MMGGLGFGDVLRTVRKDGEVLGLGGKPHGCLQVGCVFIFPRCKHCRGLTRSFGSFIRTPLRLKCSLDPYIPTLGTGSLIPCIIIVPGGQIQMYN